MLRDRILAAAFFSCLGLSAACQMHKVAQPEDVVRAVAVYEWTGDRDKPNASRLVPVTVFIDGALQDAGVYLARPIPFALDTGTIYEVDRAGKSEGTVDLMYASHLRAIDAANDFDDGWFGYGSFAPPPPPKKTAALRESKTPSVILSSKDDKPEADRPTFGHKPDDAAKKPAASSTPQGSPSDTPAQQPADDPDRPHLSKKPDPSATPDPVQPQAAPSDSSSPKPPENSSGNKPDSANDPDRPTLKKRTPEQIKKARKEAEESSATGLATSLNDDPDRPTLRHGKGQQGFTETTFPVLKGIPADLHQQVAVSDAKARPQHDFSRPWDDDAERATVLAKMQTLARAQIALYQGSKTPSPKPSPAPARRSASSKQRHATKPADASAPPLQDEQLSGYTLSYGGAATFVYTAHTAGDGEQLKYVTIVAQMDGIGGLRPAIQSVTDAAHLDRTPWMRLVDVVDPDASNRASLLFELRGDTARQFALYRVIAARSEQIFLTGTTQ